MYTFFDDDVFPESENWEVFKDRNTDLNSKVLDTAGKKARIRRRSRRKQATAKRYAFRPNTIRHAFGFYHCTRPPHVLIQINNGTKTEVAGIGRRENADQPAEQPDWW